MKNAVQQGLHGLAAIIHTGRTLKYGILALIAAGFMSLTPTAQAISQLEFLQWMVQLSGDNSMFSAGSSSSDYVTWARSRGMNPTGGWNPASALAPEQLAQVLVQFFGLSSRKYYSDYFRILEREGIDISRHGIEVSRASLASLVDDLGFQSRLFARCRFSRTKPNGHGRGDDDDGNHHGPGHGRGDDDDGHGNNRGDDDDGHGNNHGDDDGGGHHGRGDDDDGRNKDRGRRHRGGHDD
jgi:hypothetical protein